LGKSSETIVGLYEQNRSDGAIAVGDFSRTMADMLRLSIAHG